MGNHNNNLSIIQQKRDKTRAGQAGPGGRQERNPLPGPAWTAPPGWPFLWVGGGGGEGLGFTV